MTTFVLTSSYGMRNGKPHDGIDIAGVRGTPIYVNKELTVKSVGVQNGYGKTVVATDGQADYIFGHLNAYPPNLKSGDSLPPGGLVGYMGNSGRVDPAPTPDNPNAGTHLHYEVRTLNPATGRYESVNPATTIDPLNGGYPYINNASFTPNSNPANTSLLTSVTNPAYALRAPANQTATVNAQEQRRLAEERRRLAEAQAAREQLAPYMERYQQLFIDNFERRVNPVLKLGDR